MCEINLKCRKAAIKAMRLARAALATISTPHQDPTNDRK
jgi:hypothetical protein